MDEIAGDKAESVAIIRLVGIDRKAIDNGLNDVVFHIYAKALRYEFSFFGKDR
jgi:hypothetical protein